MILYKQFIHSKTDEENKKYTFNTQETPTKKLYTK